MAEEVPIKYVPNPVNYLSAPNAEGKLKFSATWSNPPQNMRDSSECRADAMTIWWTATYIEVGKSSTDIVRIKLYDNGSATNSSVDFSLRRDVGQTFFYPRGNAKLLKVVIGVSVTNVVGSSKPDNATCWIYDPAPPKITDVTFDADTGILTHHVECEERNPRQPLYDVHWKSSLTDTDRVVRKQPPVVLEGNVGDGDGDIEFDVTRDIVSWQALSEKAYRFIKVETDVYARGYHGHSTHAKKTTFIGLPLRPIIKAVGISGTQNSDRVLVRFAMDPGAYGEDKAETANTQHPYTGCRLQILRSVTETDPEAAYSMEGWEDYDVEDNGKCTALYIPLSEVRPDPDTITWLRVKCWNLSEDVLWRASVPTRLRSLEKESPTAADDSIVLVLRPGGDGTSIAADLYWAKEGTTDQSTGTQVDWSDDSYAWASTVEPSTFNTIRNDATPSNPYKVYDGKKYYGYTTLYIRNLEVGKRYFVKARRYLEGEDTTTYGPWSDKLSMFVGEAPDAVTLSAPSRVSFYEDIPVSWSIAATDEVLSKATWTLYCRQYETGDEGGRYVAATGTGGTRATVPVKTILSTIFYGDQPNWIRVNADIPVVVSPSAVYTIYLRLGVSVSNVGTIYSEMVPVTITQQPRVTLLRDGEAEQTKILFTAKEQPITFDVRASERMQALDFSIMSHGVYGPLPDGNLIQEDGNCVWTDRVSAINDADGENQVIEEATDDTSWPYIYHVTAPVIPDLIDRAHYTVNVRGIASLDSVMSNAESRVFNMDLDHKAAMPSRFDIVPVDYVDGNDVRHREATIGPIMEPLYNKYPFFSHGWPDSSYWYTTTVLEESGAEDLGDGWARLYGNYNIDPNAGKVAYNCSPKLSACPQYETGTTYTVMFEVKNIAEGTTVTVNLYKQANSSWDAAKNRTITSDGRYYLTSVSKDSFDGVTHIRVFANITGTAEERGSADVRISMYEGEYDDCYMPVAEEEKRASDRFNLYRVTMDGASLVASNLEVGDVVTDPYAPYGELGGTYRLCTVTDEGALNWWDESYELGGADMRIDFGGDYVELPYDVSMSDSFTKDFEARSHYGESRPEGYWNDTITRTSSLSTGLIRVDNADTVRKVRQLAQYVGSCFVRLPNGCAFEADVQVEEISENRMGDRGIDVSLRVTEILPTGAYEIG